VGRFSRRRRRTDSCVRAGAHEGEADLIHTTYDPNPAPASSPAILVVDDDAEIREALGDLLSDRYRLTFAEDGIAAMEAMRLQRFDLCIFDLNLPFVDGFALLEAVETSGDLPSAVMLLSAHAAPALKARALTLGATDYMTKPFDPEELLARVARILVSAAREAGLRREAMTDPLTGLANTRSYCQSLERELERARRHALPLSILTVDLDRLKTINDEHGHDAGDDALRLVAQVLAGAVRRFEVVARHGGDEFAVILPNTAAFAAGRLAERLCGEFRTLIVRGHRLSASIGVASLNESADDLSALVKASDEALYRAKAAGRDRVEIALPRKASAS
jgi:two-component system cell cycle response regulator